ncbi:hypothetical protein C2E23DRAFT_857090 [Lenzites betulinus]|nr:hypothetical protein C2E23DRAFT_857090 [Lenzites betulinus]
MLFKALPALAVVAAFAGVHAQDATSSAPPTSTSGVTACILGCIQTSAVANGCTGVTDLTCLCTSTAFQQAAASCLQSTCTADEVQAALTLQQEECASVSASASGSASATASASASETASSGASSAASAASSASSALSSIIASGTSAIASGASSLSSRLSSATAISGTGSASGSGAAASQTSNAAAALLFKPAFGVGAGGVIGVGVAIAGVVLGAGLVL